MDKDEFRAILEDLEVEPEKIEEFLGMIDGGRDDFSVVDASGIKDVELALNRLMNESIDWRKRAQYAAMLISKHLED